MEIWKDYLWVEGVWDQITLRNKHCWIIGISYQTIISNEKK